MNQHSSWNIYNVIEDLKYNLIDMNNICTQDIRARTSSAANARTVVLTPALRPLLAP